MTLTSAHLPTTQSSVILTDFHPDTLSSPSPPEPKSSPNVHTPPPSTPSVTSSSARASQAYTPASNPPSSVSASQTLSTITVRSTPPISLPLHHSSHSPLTLRKLTGYEWTRAFFERAAIKAGRASQKLTTVESMIAGAIAGSATVLLTNPIWVVNTRMTARKSESKEGVLPEVGGGSDSSQKLKKSPSTLGTLRSLIRDEGFRSLFAGVLPALVLVINPILQYTIFEQLKNAMERRKGKVGPRDAFYLGALGKLLATTITYPYITVKSRAHVASKEGPQDGMMQSLKRVIREEGWAGLYGGEFSR